MCSFFVLYFYLFIQLISVFIFISLTFKNVLGIGNIEAIMIAAPELDIATSAGRQARCASRMWHIMDMAQAICLLCSQLTSPHVLVNNIYPDIILAASRLLQLLSCFHSGTYVGSPATTPAINLQSADYNDSLTCSGTPTYSNVTIPFCSSNYGYYTTIACTGNSSSF